MRFIFLIALSLALGVLPAQGAVFSPKSTTLANGLQVVVVENARAPVISQMVWYKIGAVDEKQDGKQGLAHYLEHLMFKGTKEVPPGEFSRTVALQGGNDNAFTSYHYTAYFQQIAADRLPLVMKLEADRMQNLVLTDAVTKAELQVVLAERSERIDDDPNGRFAEEMDKVLYGNHVYGRPIIGWRKDIETLTTGDAVNFYNQWYAPNNAVLVISGDVKAEEVFKLAESTFGKVPKKDVPSHVTAAPAVLEKNERLERKDVDVRQPRWQRVWMAPGWSQDRKASEALDVLREVIGGGESGWLYRTMVRDAGLAVATRTNYEDNPFGGTFSLVIVPKQGVKLAEMEKLLEAKLAEFVKAGAPEADVAAAKRRLQREAVFSRDSLMAAGYVFGIGLTTGQTIEDQEEWPARIGMVTVDDVNKITRDVMAKPHLTAMLLPDPDKKAQKKAAPAKKPVEGGAQ